MVSPIKIGCVFDYGGKWFFDESIYLCYSGVWDSPTNETVIDSMEGEHQLGKTNADVTTISASGKRTLLYLPKGMDKIFPNLLGIYITPSGIMEITKEDLKPFPNLLAICLKKGRLTHLPPDLFEFSHKLNKIDLRDNLISTIGVNTFDGFEDLRWLELDGNECISDSAFNKTDISKLKRSIKKKCKATPT